jgi:TfoX/Sxy family transcriptional regulator of competence genes
VAYDEDLADRVRTVLPAGEAVTERQMFGGLAFMLGGHMFCGIVKDALMARLGPEAADRGSGSTPRPAMPAACRPRPPASAGDVAEGTWTAGPDVLDYLVQSAVSMGACRVSR